MSFFGGNFWGGGTAESAPGGTVSDELIVRASLSFEKLGTVAELFFGPTSFDVAGNNSAHLRQNIGLVAEVVNVGDAAPGGYFIGVNRSAANFMKLSNGAAGAVLARLKPGDVCLFRLDDDATLYAIADTAGCELEYVIVDP